MNSRDIRCANPHCNAECGTAHSATYNAPGYADPHNGAVVDEANGDIFCSQDCYHECHPAYCVDCHDEVVEKEGDRCTYCAILAAQGEDAAYSWYCSQHPELLRKPVASVSADAVRAGASGTSSREASTYRTRG